MNKFFIFFASIFGVFLTISCNDEVLSTDEKTVLKEILIFDNYQELKNEIEIIQKLSDSERIDRENSRGFYSYGTLCDECFFNINFEEINSLESLKKFDPNEEFVEIIKNDGILVFEPKEKNVAERYIANSEKLFIVSDTIYKLVNSFLVATNKENLELIRKINKIDDVKNYSCFTINKNLERLSQKSTLNEKLVDENQTWDNTYKIKLEIETVTYWTFFPSQTQRKTSFEITNYKMGILGWYVKKMNTSYSVNLVSYDDWSFIWAELSASANNHDLGSYTKSILTPISIGWTSQYKPVFGSYQASASNGYVSVSIN
jgi:hypothetical protein